MENNIKATKWIRHVLTAANIQIRHFYTEHRMNKQIEREKTNSETNINRMEYCGICGLFELTEWHNIPIDCFDGFISYETQVEYDWNLFSILRFMKYWNLVGKKWNFYSVDNEWMKERVRDREREQKWIEDWNCVGYKVPEVHPTVLHHIHCMTMRPLEFVWTTTDLDSVVWVRPLSICGKFEKTNPMNKSSHG